MRRNLTILSILLLSFFTFSQSLVSVEADEMGRGILKSRPGECFIITPAHVVKEGNQSITITGNKNVKSEGTLEYTTSPDLAIVRITGGGTQDCTDWSVATNFEEVMNNLSSAFLEFKENDGSTRLIPVYVIGKDEENITVVPQRSATTLAKGMSGASLFTQYQGTKTYLGMLQEIGIEGEGYVFQADNMERILGEFFDKKASGSNQEIQTMTLPELPAGNFTAEEGSVRIDVVKVEKLGSKVRCHLKLTALEQNTQVYLYGNQNQITEMYDQNGVGLAASKVKIANASNQYQLIYTLIKQVPVDGMIEFDGVSDEASGITYLKIHAHVPSGYTNFEYRNLSFIGLGNQVKIPALSTRGFTNESGGVQIDVVKVEKLGSKVRCHLKLIALEQNTQVYLYGNQNQITEMYDQNGVGLAASKVRIANASNQYQLIYTLIKQVPVDGMIEFDGVSDEASGITYLKIHAHVPSGYTNFEYRNLSFSGLGNQVKIPALSTSPFTNESGGVQIDVVKVEKLGSKVRCHLKLTALEHNTQVYLYGNQNQITEMYAQNGVGLAASKVRIANASNQYQLIYTLIKQVPVDGMIEFDGVSDGASGITYLKIHAHVPSGYTNFEYRNLSF